MRVNAAGEIVWEEWFKTAQIRNNVQLHPDEFVVMPNHIHGIIWIVERDDVGATRSVASTQNKPPRGPKPGSIGSMIGQFKTVTTKRINKILDSPGVPLWQRNYYDHIIRNNRELRAIRHYIRANPMNWELDQDNPLNLMSKKES